MSAIFEILMLILAVSVAEPSASVAETVRE